MSVCVHPWAHVGAGVGTGGVGLDLNAPRHKSSSPEIQFGAQFL